MSEVSQEKRQEWEERFHKQKASGLSIKHWCRANQITSQSFHYWRAKLLPKEVARSCFTELVDTKDVGILLEYNGVRIHLEKHFDVLTLKHCLEALRGITC
jgi:hypothetical protein